MGYLLHNAQKPAIITSFYDHKLASEHPLFRQYAPELGRWPSRDPLGDEATYISLSYNEEGKNFLRQFALNNFYVFVDNNSVEKSDILGLFPVSSVQTPTGAAVLLDLAGLTQAAARAGIGAVAAMNAVDLAEWAGITGESILERIRKLKKKRGVWYCVTKLPIEGDPKKCCGTVAGFGVDKARGQAKKKSTKSANDEVPRDCKGKHGNTRCIKL